MVKMTIGVEGMMCGMCEAHINDTIRNNFKVKKVKSSRKKNRTEIVAEEAIPEDELRKAIDATGYTMTGYEVHA